MVTTISNNPANLFVGGESELQKKITSKLQDVFCKQQPTSPGCLCSACKKIKNNQHSSVVWIEPEKKYVLSDLAVIFEKIRFTLEENGSFFFILNKAHLLTTVCANKLLKTLEEPPPGYNFILITNNENSILPTIRSRCYIHHSVQTEQRLFLHPLLQFFVDREKRSDPFLFDQELKKQKISEHETVDLLHDLINSIKKNIINYHKKCETEIDIINLEKNEKYQTICKTLNILQKQIQKPPQAGGAALFWRKLFVEMQ